MFDHVEIFKKKTFLLDVKTKYFLLDLRMPDVEYELQRLGDAA